MSTEISWYIKERLAAKKSSRAGLEIPGLMRAYMYAFGHKRPEKALEMLRGWNSAGLACRDCAACTARCALGFDVRTRALEPAGVLENV